MITLRMVWIAAALLIGPPLVVAATHDAWHVVVEGGEMAEASAEAMIEATNITLVEATAQYDRVAVHNMPEQLVEGHTVFATIDIPLIRNVTNWQAEVVGDVSCQTNTSTSGVYFFGIPIPTRIDRARVECQAGGRMYATPDPFYDSENTYRSSLRPTGRTWTDVTPAGQATYTEEYTFTYLREEADGTVTQGDGFVYASPVVEPWLDTNGDGKSWMISIPYAVLAEMGDRWTIVHETDPRIDLADEEAQII